MFATDEIYPPVQYAWGWLVLALSIIIVGVAIAAIVLWFTRARTDIDAADAPPVPLAAGEVIARLRAEYTATIDRIEKSYREGNINPREANLALSATVRRYVNEYSGLEAPVLALDDLERLGVHPALIDAVRRHYYPGAFRAGRTIDPIAGAAAARRVVATWH